MSREKHHQKLELEHLHHRCLCLLDKILSYRVPKDIYELILPFRHSCRNKNSLTAFLCRTEYFKNFFSVCQKRLEQTRPQNSHFCFYSKFPKYSHNFTKTSESKIFSIHNEVVIKLLTRLCLGFSHLCEHKFRFNFEYTINPLRACSIEPKTKKHFFLRFHFYNLTRATEWLTNHKSIPSYRKRWITIRYSTRR